MKFKTIAEAFNHYRTSTLEEIERRAAEIKNIVATDATADVDALNIELEGLSQAKQNVQSRAAGGQQNSFNPVAGAGMTFERRASYEATEGDVFNSAEYRSAFMKRLLGRKLNSFEEAAFGCEKSVTVDRSEPCPTCKSNGCAHGTTPEVCPDCHGTGTVTQAQRTPFGVMQSQGPCQKCRGTGKIIHQPCPDCRGSGRIRKRRTIQVTIPAGIDNGQTISLRGQGHAGSNGGPSGDLLITVMVRPHEIFRREGTSVFCEAPITFTQAVLGAELEIPTIDGRVKYTIPEGTQTGTVFRLRGKGIPVLNGRGRGDQYVTVTIETPRDLNREQKEALKRFSETLGEGNYEKHRSFFGKKK